MLITKFEILQWSNIVSANEKVPQENSAFCDHWQRPSPMLLYSVSPCSAIEVNMNSPM